MWRGSLDLADKLGVRHTEAQQIHIDRRVNVQRWRLSPSVRNALDTEQPHGAHGVFCDLEFADDSPARCRRPAIHE
jgi:hypothetical protein